MRTTLRQQFLYADEFVALPKPVHIAVEEGHHPATLRNRGSHAGPRDVARTELLHSENVMSDRILEPPAGRAAHTKTRRLHGGCAASQGGIGA